MLSTILCAALGLGGGHAALHPAGADLYLELGSGKELLTARERAPFNRLFADEELKQLYALLESFQVPLQALGEAALPPSLVGEASPFRALQRASFSAAGLDQPTGEQPLRVEIEGILDFADPAAAQAALEALDGWKAIARSTDAALAKESKLGEHVCPLRWYQSPALPFGAQGPSTFWFAQDGARLYLGAANTTPEQVGARIEGKAPGLPDEAQLFAGSELMSAPSGVPIYRLWSDLGLQGLLQAPWLAGNEHLVRSFLPTLLPYAGAQGIWRVELQGERFVTESVYRRHPGFEGKAVGKGIADVKAGRFVPKEAVGAWITNVDSAALEGEARGIVGALLARAEGAPADALEKLPLLADGLGTQAAFYLLPINSIQALVPRAFLCVELADKAKFEAALKAWAAKLAEIDPAAKVVDKPYRKLTCVSVSFGKESEEPAAASASPLGGLTPDMSLSPTIVVFEDRVLFALKKNYAQAEARRIADGKSSEPHGIANPETFPKDVFEASAMDWGGYFGKLLDIAKGLAPMAASALGENAPPIDANALPGSATLARYFKPTTSWSKRLADGRIHTHAESSFGPETPLQLLSFAAAAGPVMKDRPLGLPAKPVSAEPPVDTAAIETHSALLQVKSGLAIYKIENAKLPATLEELLAPGDRYPEGYLAPQKSVPKDGWGRALVFKPEADGKRFLLYSIGPDGKDEGGVGDDVKAP